MKLAIAGAGIGGLAAALLAKDGHEVTLFDALALSCALAPAPLPPHFIFAKILIPGQITHPSRRLL